MPELPEVTDEPFQPLPELGLAWAASYSLAMWTYTLGPLLALLPTRWRRALFGGLHIRWPRAAAISGYAECFFCLLALVAWYFNLAQRSVSPGTEITLLAAAKQGAGHPLSLLLAYFCLEGLVRAFASFVTEEAPGTLPLVALDWVLERLQERTSEALAPRVADQVTLAKGKEPWDLKVESCRRKSNWPADTIIKYQNDYYQVQERALGTGLRPYVYLLRRVPAGLAYRGHVDYDPKELLR